MIDRKFEALQLAVKFHVENSQASNKLEDVVNTAALFETYLASLLLPSVALVAVEEPNGPLSADDDEDPLS